MNQPRRTADSHSRALHLCSTLAGVLLLSACAGTPKRVESVARADLACDKVEIAEIAKNRYAASGCGKGGVYAELCGGPEGCSWVRLRGAEQAQASTAGGAVPAAPREIIQAPPPAQREVIQAPPPAQREIIQAPPPEPQAAPSSAAPASAPAADTSAQQVPLTQGDLSQPYQAEVPVAPTAQRVEYPPPAPLVETRPPPPAPNYVWAGGYWSWNNSSWLWAPGYWATPMYGYNYVPGSWYYANNYWWYGPGGWARPNSTLIVYGIGARPYRQVYTRSFTPHVHTAYPTRMGSAPLQQGRGPSRGSFQPQSSPLYRYPSSAQNPVQGGVRPSRMGSTPGGVGPGYGRTTQPSTATRFGGGPSSGGVYRSAPMGRMPSSSGSGGSFNAPMRSPSMGRMGGGSSPSFGGGGGGGGRSGGGMGRMGGGPRR